jgi:hypothetical protein
MGFFDEARDEAMKDDKGYRPHVAGQFPGTITEIRAFDHEGRTGYEIKVRTEYGVGKVTHWKASEADLPYLTQRCNGDQAEAIKRLKGSWARVVRLYVDMGLTAPANEKDLYDNLGLLVNKPCWLVVKARPDDPQNPQVYINAARANGVAKVDTTVPMGAAPQQGAAPAAGGAAGWAGGAPGPATAPQSNTPGLDHVPF